MSNDRDLKDLQEHWYAKLEAEEFPEIENTKHPNRPLVEWHSFKMTSQRFQIIQANRQLYQRQIDDFINHPSFKEACESLVKHGNCKFIRDEVELVWTLHVEGLTTRTIGRRLGRVKSRIDDVIKGLRQWMNLL